MLIAITVSDESETLCWILKNAAINYARIYYFCCRERADQANPAALRGAGEGVSGGTAKGEGGPGGCPGLPVRLLTWCSSFSRPSPLPEVGSPPRHLWRGRVPLYV